MKIGIIVDGDEEIGLGHIIRCKIIAKYLRLKCVDVSFITPDTLDTSLLENFDWIPVASDQWRNIISNREFFFNILESFEGVLLDLVEEKYSEFNFLKELPLFIISLTLFDFKKNNFGNVSFFPSIVKSRYKNDNTEIFSGPQFFIIDDKIKALKKNFLGNGTIPTLLISMGGADPFNITEKVIRSADFFDFKYKAIVIAGKVNKNKDRIKSLVEKRENFQYFDFVESIEAVYSNIDFAIINGGNTRYELTYLQIPYACISVHKIQNEINKSVTSLYGGLNLGIYNNLSEVFIANKINKIFRYSAQKNIIKHKMKSFNGGNGHVIIGDALIKKRFVYEEND